MIRGHWLAEADIRFWQASIARAFDDNAGLIQQFVTIQNALLNPPDSIQSESSASTFQPTFIPGGPRHQAGRNVCIDQRWTATAMIFPRKISIPGVPPRLEGIIRGAGLWGQGEVANRNDARIRG